MIVVEVYPVAVPRGGIVRSFGSCCVRCRGRRRHSANSHFPSCRDDHRGAVVYGDWSDGHDRDFGDDHIFNDTSADDDHDIAGGCRCVGVCVW